jgi:Fur family transcriptional regulator, ferric uptake regulator
MNFRNTKTKQAVAAVFRNSKTPLKLTEVYRLVKLIHPQIAYSTVYRIVQMFEKEKLLISVDWRERASRYEWAKHAHHHHLLCSSCGEVKDIDDATLNFNVSAVTEKTGFVINEHSIELFGLCKPCQETP